MSHATTSLNLQNLVPGQNYEAAFLDIDAAGHTATSRRYESNDFTPVMDQYRTRIQAVTASYGGEEWQWAGDGGLCVFLGDGCRHAATMAGMQIIQTWQLHRLDIVHNPLGITLPLRIAASAGPMIYRDPQATVDADCIKCAVHMQKGATDPDEFVIDETVLGELPDLLRGAFRFKEYCEGQRVFRYIPQVPGQRPEDAMVLELLERLRKRVDAVLLHVSGGAGLIGNEAVREINQASEEIYSGLRQFGQWFKYPEKIWSERYFWRLSRYTRQLLGIEARFWKGVQSWFESLSALHIQSSGLLPVRKNIAALHGAVAETDLENLKQQFAVHAREARHTGSVVVHPASERSTPSKRLVQLAHRFVAADPTGGLACFSPLAALPLDELLAGIEGDFPRHDEFVSHLGSLPDLVLSEDLSRGIGGEGGLFAALCRSREVGRRYSVLAGLLEARGLRPYEDDLRGIFKGHDLHLTASEIAGIQRAVIVAHSEKDIRLQAAEAIPLDELWQIVVYQKTPVSALAVVARRLPDWADDDLKLIFFDCVKSRLEASIRELESESVEELRMLRELLETFFRFDCFVTDSYFTPLAQMVEIHSRKASEMDETVILVGWGPMIKKFNDRTTGNPKPPRVDKLPSPAQRYLARRGLYPLLFSRSRNHLVADEVAEHISPDNVRIYLRQEQLNPQLLARFLKRPDLLREPKPLFLALTHPRCQPGYALPLLKRLNRQQLNQVMSSPSANSGVRAQARKLLAGPDR